MTQKLQHYPKFRAYNKEKNEWLYFDLESLAWGNKTQTFVQQADVIDQCTDQKDDKGEWIYRGDIVSRMCLDPNCPVTHIGVVAFNDVWGMWGIQEGKPDKRRPKDYIAPLAFGNPGKKLILALTKHGNIYQNPELLNSEKR